MYVLILLCNRFGSGCAIIEYPMRKYPGVSANRSVALFVMEHSGLEFKTFFIWAKTVESSLYVIHDCPSTHFK